MTPRQMLVALLGLGLVAFRLMTDPTQRTPLGGLFVGRINPGDGGNALGTQDHPGGLLLPGGLGGTGSGYPTTPQAPGVPLPHAPGVGPITNTQPGSLGDFYGGLAGVPGK